MEEKMKKFWKRSKRKLGEDEVRIITVDEEKGSVIKCVMRKSMK